MKRKWKILIIFICTMVCIDRCYYVSKSRIEVVSTRNLISKNNITLELDVVLNKRFNQDCEKTAEEIVQHCVENNFENIMLSYDKGYPNELIARVYLTRENFDKGNCYYELNYSLKENSDERTYNIVENREKYLLVIKKQ